ncbi:hypothetical protein D3C76_1666560 [compost metagenome]
MSPRLLPRFTQNFSAGHWYSACIGLVRGCGAVRSTGAPRRAVPDSDLALNPMKTKEKRSQGQSLRRFARTKAGS